MPIKLQTDGWAVVRTPLLPVRDVLDLGAACTNPGASAEEREQAVVADAAMVRAWITGKLEDPVIREALFVASPDLLAAEPLWKQDPDSKKGRRFETAVYRYLQRMATRCTPYGVFAGVSLGSVGEGPTGFRVAEPTAHRKFTRFDMDYLCLLCEHLADTPEVRSRIGWRSNDSIHQVGERIVYVGHTSNQETRVRSHFLRDAGASDALLRVIEASRSPRRLAEIAAIFDGDPDNDPGEAMAFVEQAAAAQLLVPELWPIVSGDHPAQELVTQLRECGCSSQAEALARAQAMLDELDASGLGASPERYQGVAEHLRASFPGVKAAIERLFQVDLKVTSEIRLNAEELQASIDETMEVLESISGAITPQNPLADFISAFSDRYEDREVPLLEALDEEHGIGPDGRAGGFVESELLAGLDLGRGPRQDSLVLTGFGRWKRQALLDSAADGFRPVRIEVGDLRRLIAEGAPSGRVGGGNLPVAFPMVQVTKEGNAFQNLQMGLEMLGRFAGMDDHMLQLIRSCADRAAESEPGVIYAQICHHPGGRVGNVLLRPRLRQKELVFLGRTDAPEAGCISAADLLVSVRGGLVVLRDGRTGDKVVPVMDNAHNFSKATVGAYRFLNLVSRQIPALGLTGWYWGEEFEAVERLPRVVVGRTILEPATWNLRIGKGEQRLLGLPQLMEWAQELRRSKGLPQQAVLVDTDNQLLVDFRNPLSVSAFVAAIGTRDRIKMQEWLAPEGEFANEVLVAMSSIREQSPADMPGQDWPVLHGDRRSFEPGSEWLYLKAYCAPSVQDRIVRDRLPRLTPGMLDEGLIDKWFFIRYQDKGGPHLRVRFHLPDPAGVGRVLRLARAAMDDFLTAGMVHQLTVDTYNRELERYGIGPGLMEAAESLFWIDSELVCGLIESTLPEDRWMAAVLVIEWYLRAFRVPEGERLDFVRGASESYLREYRLTEAEKQRPLGEFFRKHRPSGIVPASMQNREAVEAALDRAGTHFERLWPLYEKQPRTSIMILLQSYIHMAMNRLFYADQRAHEMAVYAYLARALESLEARKKKPGPATTD